MKPGNPAVPDIACDLDRTSTATLRRLVRQLLDGYAGVAVEDAVLVTDELVSNALRHGDAPRHCRLWFSEQRGGLRIEVDDTGPGQPRMATPDSAGGRGLLLVDRLATRWGVRRGSPRKTVWAEVDLRNQSAGSPVLRPSSPGWTQHP